MSSLLPPMKWDAWGDPEAAQPLSEGIRSLLKQALGVHDSPVAAPDIDDVRVRPSTLPAPDRDALAAIVGTDHLCADDRSRLLHAGGKSTLDLLRRKDTGVQDAPDAVLLPGDEDEIAAILRHCSQHRIAVVPFGGGTSVVGGLDPVRGPFTAAVTLDLRRLDRLHSLDGVSWEAELGAGVSGPDAERLLSEHRFSLALPAEFPVRDDRRVRGDTLLRPGLGRLRPVQRDDPRAARRRARRGSRSRARAGIGCRPGPAP